ncbi:MAG: Rho termination factor N-terminal domain-containing protein [Thermodesulfobacteriota bacterium]
MAEKKKKEGAEKPLEKMTVKELREIAKEIAGITGVHGMNKPELYSAVCQAKGIAEKPAKTKADASVRNIKKKIRALKAVRRGALEADDRKKAVICRRRISRLKKKTRRAA